MRKTTMTRAGGLPVPVRFAASGCRLIVVLLTPTPTPLSAKFIFLSSPFSYVET